MTCSGRGTANSDTMSTGTPGSSRSTNVLVRARTASSSPRMNFGRKPGCTRARYRVWSGGSVCMMVGGVG